MNTEKSATVRLSRGAAPRETLTPKSAIHGNVAFDCGWGRLMFGQTFATASDLAECLRAERPGQRDIAFYVLDPHVVLAAAPQELFLDPSHTYRLELDKYGPAETKPRGFRVRHLDSLRDAEEINRIYAARRMVTVAPNFFWEHRDDDAITYFVAVDDQTDAIVGTVTGVDHKAAFGDLENGSSLWCLAVDTQSTLPGIGEALVRRLSEHFKERGCAYMDLSVLHDNKLAIALYEKLGFIRWATFTIKHKNVINENLFTETSDEYDVLNPYARIIVDEAQRRGIGVDIIDAEGGFFRLTHGGRSVACRESLTSLTTAIAMSVCDDKRVTCRIVEARGVRVPQQITVEDEAGAKAFVEQRDAVVVKPARGEQGKGVAVGLKDWTDAKAAIDYAKTICNDVIVEDFIAGVDLRIVVINYRVVAAAIRKPATIVGNGKSTVRELIERQTRRRLAATGGARGSRRRRAAARASAPRPAKKARQKIDRTKKRAGTRRRSKPGTKCPSGSKTATWPRARQTAASTPSAMRRGRGGRVFRSSMKPMTAMPTTPATVPTMIGEAEEVPEKRSVYHRSSSGPPWRSP